MGGVLLSGVRQSKLDTDLFELMKKKTVPTSVDVSGDGSKFVVVGKDKQVRGGTGTQTNTIHPSYIHTYLHIIHRFIQL